jgi:hypothetical protein
MTNGKEYVPFLEKKAQQETNITHPHEITLDTPVPSLELSTRLYNTLMNDRLYTIGDVVECSSKELLRVPNFGRKCLEEIEGVLSCAGLALRDPNTEKPVPPPSPQPTPVWIYTSTDMPASGRQVLFRTWTGQIFYGGFLDGFGWFVPQPRNMSHDWDTLIKVNSGVAAWMKVPPLTGIPEAF